MQFLGQTAKPPEHQLAGCGTISIQYTILGWLFFRKVNNNNNKKEVFHVINVQHTAERAIINEGWFLNGKMSKRSD